MCDNVREITTLEYENIECERMSNLKAIEIQVEGAGDIPEQNVFPQEAVKMYNREKENTLCYS